tara:strand:+ start:324 stop:1259 length:936 start_codon:yes stop_codon:yes gene_type:complete
MSRNINYFDLGAHTGTEITTFLWHINFLRKNDYLKDCVVNIYGFEPSPIIGFLEERVNAIKASILKNRKDWTDKEKYHPFLSHEIDYLDVFNQMLNKEKTNLLKTDVENIHIYEKAVTNVEGEFKLFLSERIEEYTDERVDGGGYDWKKDGLQPMDYIGSTLFSSKVTGGININNYKLVDGVIFSKWIKENIDNFEDSINIVKMNIEGSESMVIGDLIESDMLKHFQIICGYDLLADVKKIPELENTNEEFEKMIEDNDIPSRFIHFCSDNLTHTVKDFEQMSERIATESIKKGWEGEGGDTVIVEIRGNE